MTEREQIDPRTIRPNELKTGQYAIFTVKIMITRPGHYRVYNCNPESTDDRGIPQGTRILHAQDICLALFPTLYNNAQPDY